MEDVRLADEERNILKGYKLNAPYLLMKLKSDALLLLDLKVDIQIVARIVDRAPSTIRTWVHDWGKARLSSIYTGHAGNLNASKLTAGQRAEVTRVLAQPPNAHGLPSQFWAVPDLKTWLSARFDVVYESASSYHFLLHLAGLSFHKPEPFDARRADEGAITERIDQIRTEIAPHLADPHTIVYAADEVRIDQEAIVRRAWYAQGTKTKLKVDRRRDSQNYIGFLNQTTGECELIPLQWQNGPLILQALTHLTETHHGEAPRVGWRGQGLAVLGVLAACLVA